MTLSIHLDKVMVGGLSVEEYVFVLTVKGIHECVTRNRG
jgi:hypothetical protein